MFFAKKVTSKGGFSVFFLDICHTNDKFLLFLSEKFPATLLL